MLTDSLKPEVTPLAGRRPDQAARPRLGEILCRRGAIAPSDLRTALTLQRQQAVPLGQLLRLQGVLSEEALAEALAEQFGLARIDLNRWPPEPGLMAGVSPEICLKHGLIPWRREWAKMLVACFNPASFEQDSGFLPFETEPVLANRTQIEQHLGRITGDYLSERASTLCPASVSARGWARPLRRPLVFGALALILTLAASLPQFTIWLLFFWLLMTLAAVSFVRLAALFVQFRSRTQALTTDPPVLPPVLPVVSLIVPLFRESAILPQLVTRLSDSDYPRELLDILLVVEESDHKTRNTLETLELPLWMRVVRVPKSRVQTKPRAMNYALGFCRGSIIGIYDAEDAPERDQIRRMVAKFYDSGPEVACIQGYLDFYNPRENWLSRCFTIEYALWFRVMLHGIERLRLPVPLGGTTVFFRRHVLEELGAWDAHNVTEDADLGFRLARRGYRCGFLATTTYEEANCRALPWVRQRSRWLKGYAMTWITHMRTPRALWRELGPRGFLAFQVILLGTLSSFALAPFIWSLWLISFGVELPFADLLPWQGWTILGSAFVAAEALLMLVGFYAVSGKGHRHLLIFVPTMILYWPLGSLAVYKALYELLLAPFYWDKTSHGVSVPDPVV